MSLPNEGAVIFESILVKVLKDIIDDEVENFWGYLDFVALYFFVEYVYFNPCSGEIVA